MTRQSGFTLIELLISLGLALGLVVAILQVYRLGTALLRWQVEAARLEENGRYALGLIARELEMAGFFARLPASALQEASAALPSGAPQPGTPDCGASAGWALDAATPLDILDNHSGDEARFQSGKRLSCLPEASLLAGSDALAVKRSAALPTHSPDSTAPRRGLILPRWFLRTGGGEPASLVWRDEADGAPAVDSTQDWWEWRASIFYLRDYSAAPGDGVPSLCQERLAGTLRSVCLVEDVEALQVEIGVDRDADGVADDYLASPSPEALDTAVSARVFLLLRSRDAVFSRPQAVDFQLGAQPYRAEPDRHLRRLFARTVRLPNLSPGVLSHASAD